VASNIFKSIGDKLADFVDWIKETMEDEAIRKSIAEDMGLQPGESVPKADLPQDKLDSINSYRSKANPDKEAFIILLNDVRDVYQAARGFISAIGISGVSAINQGTFTLFDLMALNYFRIYTPQLFFGIQLLASLVEDSSALEEDELEVRRFFKAVLKAINFILSPFYYVVTSLKAGAEDEKKARRVSEATLALLAGGVSFVTKEINYGWDSFEVAKKEACLDNTSKSTTPKADVISERMLTIGFPFDQDPSSESELDESLKLSLAIKAKTETDITGGLFIGVGGNGEVEIGLTDRWKFLIQASADPAFSVLFDVSNMDISAHGPVDLPLNIALVSIPDEKDVTYAFPKDEATRVEVGQIAFSFNFDGKKGGIKAEALRCALVIGTKDQDGFLAKVLPSDGLRVPFNFGAGFSTESGFFTSGNIPWLSGRSTKPISPPQPPPSPSSELRPPSGGDLLRQPSMARSLAKASDTPETIPNLSGTSRPELGIHQIISIGKALLAVRLDHILLGLSPATDTSSAQARTEVSISMAIRIGPVLATVERIGFEMGLAFPESGGNVGFADFSMGFKPPNGAGIKVSLPAVSGGGFLFLDHEKGQYAGFVQLTINDFITVNAIGLIATRLPSGEKGFSFLIMITVENFKPINLPLGFKLTAIGGLVAINRTCNTEFLRDGIKNNSLDHILFPKDPIRNAVQIFGTLNKAFPPQDGSYFFGPMVQICWGTPSIITMDLALILELGNRTRLIILGRMRAIMPSEKHDLLRLQMNVLGEIDFDQKSISLDAVLYDSRLVGKYPITGGMAMRLRWGSDPIFALSIGGFHPAFKPPAGFPALERLAISLSDTESFRLRAEIYVAITSNTLQFGGKLEMYAKVGGFSVEGRVGIDVLIQFDPFFFLADFYASVQLKRGSHNLFKVKLEGHISGPRPLNVKGKATFEILWCDFSVGFDKTLVKGEKPPQLEPVVVMQQLKVALSDSRNWSGQLAEGERRMVTLREAQPADQIALHPLGKLSVKQNVVPLDLDIARFGSAKPAGARHFKIDSLSVNGKAVSFSREKDFFAPSQFLELSDDEKLAAPSFESMTAGISAGADSFIFTANDEDILEDEAITFETVIIDKENKESREAEPFAISAASLGRTIFLGAAARSEIRRAGTAKYRPTAGKNTLVKKGWSIASTEDGSPQAAPGLEAGEVASYSESFQALQRLKRENPVKGRAMMLVRVSQSRN